MVILTIAEEGEIGHYSPSLLFFNAEDRAETEQPPPPRDQRERGRGGCAGYRKKAAEDELGATDSRMLQDLTQNISCDIMRGTKGRV